MKFTHSSSHRLAALCGSALVAASLAASAQTTIFDDTFTGASTLNSAPGVPTPTSTDYQAGSGLAGSSSSIGANDLKLTLPSTTSVLGEFQGLFSSSPIALATTGDYVDLSVTFTGTGVLNGGAGSSITMGLYNSGGSAPQQGTTVFNSLVSPTGGAQNWLGFASRDIQSGSSQIITRPKQTSATSAQNQELLFNNASSSQAFNSPSGANIGSTTSALTNVDGTTYTMFFRITLASATSVTISNALFSGTDTTGTLLFGQMKTASSANFVTNSFDGLAFGWRNSSTVAAATTMDVSHILVRDSIAVPEPSSFAILAVGGAGFVWARRRSKRSRR